MGVCPAAQVLSISGHGGIPYEGQLFLVEILKLGDVGFPYIHSGTWVFKRGFCPPWVGSLSKQGGM